MKRQDYKEKRSKKRTRIRNRKNGSFRSQFPDLVKSVETGRREGGERERQSEAEGRGQGEEKNAGGGRARGATCNRVSYVYTYVPPSRTIVNDDSHSRNSPFSFSVRLAVKRIKENT